MVFVCNLANRLSYHPSLDQHSLEVTIFSPSDMPRVPNEDLFKFLIIKNPRQIRH